MDDDGAIYIIARNFPTNICLLLNDKWFLNSYFCHFSFSWCRMLILYFFLEKIIALMYITFFILLYLLLNRKDLSSSWYCSIVYSHLERFNNFSHLIIFLFLRFNNFLFNDERYILLTNVKLFQSLVDELCIVPKFTLI